MEILDVEEIAIKVVIHLGVMNLDVKKVFIVLMEFVGIVKLILHIVESVHIYLLKE